MTLGELFTIQVDGALTIEKARRMALIERAKVLEGRDPAADKRLIRERLSAKTFKDAWPLYEATLPPGRTKTETVRRIRADALPALGGVPLAILERRHLAGMLSRVKTRSPSVAQVLASKLRRFFEWAVDQGVIDVNPMALMKMRGTANSRERWLTESEVGAFWRATSKLNYPWSSIYQLLILTATRREEVAGMEWRELNLDKGVWTIPKARTKTKKANHVIDLPPIALEIIKSAPNTCQFVFSVRRNKAPRGWARAKAQLDTLMREDIGDFEPFVTHDLRRTVVSHLAERFNVDPFINEQILNHAKKGIIGVYQQQTYRDRRLEALSTWETYLDLLKHTV